MINSTNLIVNQDGSIFHLGVKPEELASSVILVGDPGRVQLIASFFEHIECKRQNREFVMITGLYKGIRISVMATGIGTDNIDIVLNEIDALVNVDFDKRKIKHELTKLNLLRLGTCGSFQKHVKPGDLVISKKAYGQDSLMLYYQDYLSKFIKDNKELKAVQQYFSEHHLGPVNYIAESNDYLLKKFESIIIVGTVFLFLYGFLDDCSASNIPLNRGDVYKVPSLNFTIKLISIPDTAVILPTETSLNVKKFCGYFPVNLIFPPLLV